MSDCQAVMVPSFFAATLILAKAEGRLPAIFNSVARSRNIFTGLPPLAFESSAGLHAPAIGRELAAESAADVLHLHVDVGGRHFQRLAQIAADTGDVLRGRPQVDLVAAELHDVAVRFQAAVRDHRNAVGAFDHDIGFLEGLVRIAGHLLARRLGAIAGLARSSSCTRCGRTSYSTLILRTASLASLFAHRRHRRDLGALPLHFLARRRSSRAPL